MSDCNHTANQGDGHCAYCGYRFVLDYVHYRCTGCRQELCLCCFIYHPWEPRPRPSLEQLQSVLEVLR